MSLSPAIRTSAKSQCSQRFMLSCERLYGNNDADLVQVVSDVILDNTGLDVVSIIGRVVIVML
jgi:hypothetical protein